MDDDGRPTFPILHERDERGRPVAVLRNAVPSWHSWRHGVASQAISEGESADELAFVLGHGDATVTRRVYSQLVESEERQERRRSIVEARYGGMLAELAEATDPPPAAPEPGEVVSLDLVRGVAS